MGLWNLYTLGYIKTSIYKANGRRCLHRETGGDRLNIYDDAWKKKKKKKTGTLPKSFYCWTRPFIYKRENIYIFFNIKKKFFKKRRIRRERR